MNLSDFNALIHSPFAVEEVAAIWGNHAVVVEVGEGENTSLESANWPQSPVIGVGGEHPAMDLWVENAEQLQVVLQAIAAQPVAATVLIQVLRHNAQADITNGLLAESLAYSALQHSESFEKWLSSNHRGPSEPGLVEPVILAREAGCLRLTLNTPVRHNAFSEEMKEALCTGLQLALTDATITQVALDGAGPSFCAGGDLTQFGRARDAGIAHLSRTTRSAGQLLATLAQIPGKRVSVAVQGACIGAGIELPAFANHIEAAPDAFFQLPEVSMGLIPGAGGTVSLPRRIGRQRTAYMALTNERVPAEQALSWGLVDTLTRG
jgi:enoyl-CoA hydratase